MKTKDLIKMLQEEDPTGESHVRIDGGAISHCEGKPGYWDGAYSYFEDGVYVVSTLDYKIDIITRDIDDFIWNLNEQGFSLDEVKEKIRCDYNYCDKKHEENFWKHVEKEYNEAKKCIDQLNKELVERTLKKYKEGWKPRHLKSDDHRKYYWKWSWIKELKKTQWFLVRSKQLQISISFIQ